MGSMKINFAEVEGSFQPMPEGQYEVIIDKVEVRESKSSDHNYLNWELVVQDDENEGRRLWMITSLSPKALFRLKDVFSALGLDVEADDFELVWDEEVEVTPQSGPLVLEPDITGMACVAVVRNEVYDGKERNKVDEILSADNATPTAGKGAAKRAPQKAASGRRSLR